MGRWRRASCPPASPGFLRASRCGKKCSTLRRFVLVGTLEDDGTPDLAPKHMAMPLGRESRFCFVCSYRHATLRNAIAREAFTVSFPRPGQILDTSLAAGGRAEDSSKPGLAALRTFPATAVEGVLVEGCYLHLECRLERIVEGFDDSVLVVGEVVAADVAEDAARHSDDDDADVIAASPLLVYVSRAGSRPSPRLCRIRSPSTSARDGRREWVRDPRVASGARESMVDLLVRLATAESPTVVPEAQAAPLGVLCKELERDSLSVRRLRGERTGGVLYARPDVRRRGAPYQLLVGHADTIWPLGSVEEIGIARENGIVRGPGVYDMKGGLVEIVFALRALAELGVEPDVTPVVVVNTDEEIESQVATAARAARATRLAPSSSRARTGRRES